MPQHHLVFFSKFPKSYQKLFSNSWGNIGFLWLAGGFSGEQKWAIYNKISFDWGPQDKKGPGKIKTRSPFWARARSAQPRPSLSFGPLSPRGPLSKEILLYTLWILVAKTKHMKRIEIQSKDSWASRLLMETHNEWCFKKILCNNW